MSDSSRTLTATRGDAGQRLDLMLRRHLMDCHSVTRTRVQAWIENGQVAINGKPVCRSATRVTLGDRIAVALPTDVEHQRLASTGGGHGRMLPEDVELAVLYEDEHLLAVDKPAGVVVHPGYKHVTGTLMNALLWRARDWSAPSRPSIVGRLDQHTSGIVLVAKSAAAHAALQRAMATYADKQYLAVVYGRVNVARGEINAPLRRALGDRRRVVVSPTDGAPSLTRFERLARVAASRAGLSLVRCRLVTGRMHQIRVHLAARGWPVVGDPAYGEPLWSRVDDARIAAILKAFPRQALHAWRLTLSHPVTRQRLNFEARVPHDLVELLAVSGLAAGDVQDLLRSGDHSLAGGESMLPERSS